MFADIPSPSFGLNFDPSHLVWQQMDYLAPLAEFRDRLVHVHAKDARIDRAALDAARRPRRTPSSGTPPSSPAWATSAGAPSSGPWPTPATTATSPSRSRTGRSKGSLRKREESLVISRRYLLQYMIG